MDAREQLIAIYMDYFNNYLSAKTYGEHNGLSYTQAVALLELARDVARSAHPEE